MHEYTIAYDIYSTAKRAALENSATQVKKVCVAIGEMTMISPEQVKFLFEVLTDDDELFSGVVLESHKVPVKTRCSCGYEGTEKFVCPDCGALPEVIEGREIMVSNIEIEVDDA